MSLQHDPRLITHDAHFSEMGELALERWYFSSFFSSAAAGAEPAAGAAEPGAAETATAPPAGTLASLPTP